MTESTPGPALMKPCLTWMKLWLAIWARQRSDSQAARGVPIKKIARDLRVSRNTVRKVIRGEETSFSYARKIQPMPKLGPWVGELERRLEDNEKKRRRDRLSLLQIYEDLAALGYEGGYDAVRRYAKAWRRRHAHRL